MPTPKKGPRLASSPAHERLMLANMATSLFANGRIKTTLPKAKRLRPLVERLISFAKRGDLHSRRRVMRVIRNKSIVHKLFTEIASPEASAVSSSSHSLVAKAYGGSMRISSKGAPA